LILVLGFHAMRVSLLPVPNDHGTFLHTPPDLSTSAAIGDYIRARTAAWKQHQQHRKALTPMASANAMLEAREGHRRG
jgi:phospholipase C